MTDPLAPPPDSTAELLDALCRRNLELLSDVSTLRLLVCSMAAGIPVERMPLIERVMLQVTLDGWSQ